jgi:NAD(P)H-hydrate epimerase
MPERTPSIPSISTQQMIEVDRLMIEEYGITLIQMMENAGRSLAEMARRMCDELVQRKQILVLCGLGNNGGGGMVAARHLHNGGSQVQAILVGEVDRLRDVPAHQWRILQRMGVASQANTLPAADLIVDALLGYGAQGNPRSPIREWIESANQSGVPTLSLDAPSGLDSTTGQPGDPCIQAALR